MCNTQTKWLTVLLNEGVEPASNKTIIPRSAFEEITTAHSIQAGKPTIPEMSIQGYGLGWWRFSYQGHDVCLSPFVFTPSAALAGAHECRYFAGPYSFRRDTWVFDARGFSAR